MSAQLPSRDEEILGRPAVDDLEAILTTANTDVDEVIHAVRDNADVIFTWDYEKGARPALDKLYEKAKGSQWNGQTDLDWSIDVDQQQFAEMMADMQQMEFEARGVDFTGTPFEKWTRTEWVELAHEVQNWSLSQFMHGEQGALLCTAKIVETVPWIDAKYYAATQVMDEARHVEVFAQYLDTKLDGHYPINTHLKLLLDDIIDDSRWDMTYLGMQIMVEGLALAAFGMALQTTPDPLLKRLLRYVMSDEARHVAFGVLSLQEFYAGLTDAELLDRHGRWYVAERDPVHLRRNALVALGNVGDGTDPAVRAALAAALEHPQALVRGHAVWAARRLGCDDLTSVVADDPHPLVRDELAAPVAPRPSTPSGSS